MFLFQKILKNFASKFKRLWAGSWASAFLCCLLLAPAPAEAQDICGYSNPEYSVYNRLLKVEVNRGGQKVGEVHYSYQFDGYYVRCVTGGVPKRRFFARARDARWAACGSCY